MPRDGTVDKTCVIPRSSGRYVVDEYQGHSLLITSPTKPERVAIIRSSSTPILYYSYSLLTTITVIMITRKLLRLFTIKVQDMKTACSLS